MNIQSIDGKIQLLPFIREAITSILDIRQKSGWEITAFNLPASWKNSQGEGVKVAVLDTGCDLNHPDLVDNLLPGFNFVKRGTPPDDDNGHGSHVTGTICASNNDIGIVGVAPKAKVVPVKVLDENGSGDLDAVAEGIRWSANQGVDFITMSLGSSTETPQLYEAIVYAERKGVVTFCAAGNAGQTRQIFYPAAYPNVIGIGAIDSNFDRANFSCTGPDLDFLAPGVKILSTVPTNSYEYLSGTSMSTPFAVGVACLLLSFTRVNHVDFGLKTAQDYIKIFKQCTIPVSNPQFAKKHFFEGFGIIDPRKINEWISSHQN